MARSRTPKGSRTVRVRKRDYAAGDARRQAKARSLGYTGYYGRRIRLGAPASVARPRGAVLATRRGHRGKGEPGTGGGLRRRARDGDLLIASMGARNAAGEYTNLSITLVSSDGGEHASLLSGAQSKRAARGKGGAEREAAGGICSPAPSPDRRRRSEGARSRSAL